MFEQFPDIGHYCKMNKFFNECWLGKEGLLVPTWVLMHGIKKSICGVPLCVMQEEKTGKAAERAQGMVKASVLKSNDKSFDLIVAHYDQKPCFMLSHNIKDLSWVKCKKKA